MNDTKGDIVVRMFVKGFTLLFNMNIINRLISFLSMMFWNLKTCITFSLFPNITKLCIMIDNSEDKRQTISSTFFQSEIKMLKSKIVFVIYPCILYSMSWIIASDYRWQHVYWIWCWQWHSLPIHFNLNGRLSYVNVSIIVIKLYIL